MKSRYNPDSLYLLCLDFCIPRMVANWSCESCSECRATMESLGGSVSQDLLSRAFHLANSKSPVIRKWMDEWRMFYTSKISSAIVSWDEDLITHLRNRCKVLKRIEVVHMKKFQSKLILDCPKTVLTLDFDGELVNRGKPASLPPAGGNSWLCDSEKILRSILVSNMKVPEYAPVPGMLAMSEIHLGNVPAAAEDLTAILSNCGNLKLLKHYQLVSALYKLHGDSWRRKASLPVYKLENLDVDFSHVVRCRMSPEWVLAPDALHLAVKLCPKARSVRVRFDCSTPHDALAPIAALETLTEYSAVCVSSGERSNIDFSDMTAILEKHGPKNLKYLELKVIEEVEIHIITSSCSKLNTLILSGCGYVTPPTCASYCCQSHRPGSMKRLRLLFYADGDDFSWDHGVPECFWKATLLPSGTSQTPLLEGIFLEYPRISRSLTSQIFSPPGHRIPFPSLLALSFCRYEEITVDDVASVCGLSKTGAAASASPSLRYIRLSDCEKIDEPEEKRLRKWLKQAGMGDLRVDTDR